MGLVGTYNLSLPDVACLIEECIHLVSVVAVLTGYRLGCNDVLLILRALETAISTVTCAVCTSLDRWHQNGSGKSGAGKTAVRGRAGVINHRSRSVCDWVDGGRRRGA